jgi:hypothetical protein
MMHGKKTIKLYESTLANCYVLPLPSYMNGVGNYMKRH